MQKARAELEDIFVKPTRKERSAGKDLNDAGANPAGNKRRLSSSPGGAKRNVDMAMPAPEVASVRDAQPKRKRAVTDGADARGNERMHGHNSWRTPQPPPSLSALADSLKIAGSGSLSGSVTESVAGSVSSDRRKSANGVTPKRRESNGTPAAAKRARVSSGLSTPSERASGEMGYSGTRNTLRGTSPQRLSSGKSGKKSPQSGGIGSDSKGETPKPLKALKAEHRREARARASDGAPRIGEEVGHVLLVTGLPAQCTVKQLERHFGRCAPLQLDILRDWGSRKLRGSACLAVSTDSAASFTRRESMETLENGAKIKVLTAGTSAHVDDGFDAAMSTAMRSARVTMEAKVKQVLGRVPSSLRHLLLCCERESAAAAVEEWATTVESGAVKDKAELLLKTLLRHRRHSGGQVWLGRVRGLPLPSTAAARLHALLRDLDWSSMPADGKLRGEMAENSFKLGLSTKLLSKHNGPYVPCAFKDGMGVWDGASITRKHASLWKAASELIGQFDPQFHFTTVQFNKNFRGVRHRDDKDASHQVATAFGEYTGGELRVIGENGVTDVDTRHRYVRFDGRYEHEVLPYEGTRYSVIYFQLVPPWSVDPTSTQEGAAL